MPTELSQLLLQLIQREEPILRALPESDSPVRPGAEGTWSPREELGHLIDSAANNHIRFVRASIEPEFRGPRYAQNDWVKVHGYQEMAWQSVVETWATYNRLLAELLNHIPENKLQTSCFVGDNEGVSLRFLIEDYVLHMQHHIDRLLRRQHVTQYPAVQTR